MPLDAPTFAAIVHDGVLREQGMPAFPELGTGSVAEELDAAMRERRPVTVDFQSRTLVGKFEINAFPAPEGGLTPYRRAVDLAIGRVDADTVCVHGDSPGAVVMARRVRERLEAAGVGLAPFVGGSA